VLEQCKSKTLLTSSLLELPNILILSTCHHRCAMGRKSELEWFEALRLFLGGIVGRLDRTSKADSFATSGLFYSELFLSPGELGRIH